MSDSTIEIGSALYFPDLMAKYKVRIARPLKNAVISAVVAVSSKWFHLVFATHRTHPYMFYDAFAGIAMLIAWAYPQIEARWLLPIKLPVVIGLYLAAHGIINVLAIIQLPWKHPLAGLPP